MFVILYKFSGTSWDLWMSNWLITKLYLRELWNSLVFEEHSFCALLSSYWWFLPLLISGFCKCISSFIHFLRMPSSNNSKHSQSLLCTPASKVYYTKTFFLYLQDIHSILADRAQSNTQDSCFSQRITASRWITFFWHIIFVHYI